MTSTALAADFPKVADLPANPNLPDPLIRMNGRRVMSKEEWFQERRPELKQLFQHYMYGHVDHELVKLVAAVQREDKHYFGGKATKKEVTIFLRGKLDKPQIHLLLVIPNRRQGPAPVFVGMNFCGNHTLVNDPSIPLPSSWMYPHCPGCENHHATDAGRGGQIDVWALEQSIDHGYAVATFYNGDISPDRPDDPDALQRLLWTKRSQYRAGPYDWATIMCWAWGVSRAVDYLVTDKDIDKDRIAVVGHSRLGKTALLAAAFDERIALAIPLQAGCGGTAPSRGKIGESVKQINKGFPHWFNATFKEFNDHPEKLPFDQNSLVALAAPRPVLFANATEDTWANPEGQFEVLKAADPVYRFLGVAGLAVDKMPETGKLVESRLGYYIRPGKHSMTREDWKVFIQFADKHFKKGN
jgi:hypothetical protein